MKYPQSWPGLPHGRVTRVPRTVVAHRGSDTEKQASKNKMIIEWFTDLDSAVHCRLAEYRNSGLAFALFAPALAALAFAALGL